MAFEQITPAQHMSFDCNKIPINLSSLSYAIKMLEFFKIDSMEFSQTLSQFFKDYMYVF